MKKIIQLLTSLLIVISSMPVHAHKGIDASNGFYSGFIHPWSGTDHWLVMFAVGLYAATLNYRIAYGLPVSFVVFMIVGTALVHFGFSMPALEENILFSVLFMGILLVFKPTMFRLTAFVLVSYFAMYHGYAHALEISPGDDEVLYVSGFVFSTLLLHCIGLLTGRLRQKQVIFIRILTGFFSIVVATLALNH